MNNLLEAVPIPLRLLSTQKRGKSLSEKAFQNFPQFGTSVALIKGVCTTLAPLEMSGVEEGDMMVAYVMLGVLAVVVFLCMPWPLIGHTHRG